MTETKLAWSVPVALADIPDTGQRFDLVANDETRASVAKLAGLRALPRLEATLDLSPRAAGGLRVTGQVVATVGQTCVVTLDPIENEVTEDVSLVFAAPRQQDDDIEKNLAPDAPEPLLGDAIDLGAIATEFLLLGIVPYPRKPDAKFEAPPVEDVTTRPFAALAALKKGQGGKND